MLLDGIIDQNEENYDKRWQMVKKVHLSDECKDFITCLLNKDRQTGLTAKDALKHVFGGS